MVGAEIAVVGAGVIGRGVALRAAQAGHAVTLLDVSHEVLDTALREIRRQARLSRMLRKQDPADEDALLRIRPSVDYAELSAASFAIENVTEDFDVKRSVYEQLDRHCPPACILAANTSAILIQALVACTGRPDRVLGIHFMNPVTLISTVEVIRTPATSRETLQAARELLNGLRMKSIVVNDAPGFVSNRVLMLTVNEAIALVAEGVASPEDTDQIFRSCFGHRMGPLATADLIGLDTVLRSLRMLQRFKDETRFAPSPLLEEMVAKGWLGRKSGRGFFSYGPGAGSEEGP
jgi:3-hydroxybutyryl-CoA dehydrogenase